MFKQNHAHRQTSLFGMQQQMPKDKAERLRQSWAWAFYELVFCRIDEALFAVLYDSGNGRPNAAVNRLVAAEVLLHWRGWTVEELFEHLDFDLLARTALGMDDLDSSPFCPATLFNFRNRLLSHYRETGDNPMEQVFDSLTAAQMKRLGVRADIQRCDSFQALSNISRYSRVQLLVEVLLRLFRVLDEDDRQRLSEPLSAYTGDTSQRFVYTLERDALPRELEKLAAVYGRLHAELKDKYGDTAAFQVFERVFAEHFAVVDERIQARPPESLGSGTLQSPDDLDATYRHKRGEDFRGQVVNVVETASPDNQVNLITDVAVAPNNVDDGAVLNGRLDAIVAKTPELAELHTDGGYGSAANDARMAELAIVHVQTAVRGRKAAVPMRIAPTADPDVYAVSCPCETVASEPTRRRFKAVFPACRCADCPQAGKCPAGRRKGGHRVFFFDRAAAAASVRNHNIEAIPAQRRTLRANVEATMKEFTAPFNHKGKLKVRGAFATGMVMLAMAIAINFGRVRRALANDRPSGEASTSAAGSAAPAAPAVAVAVTGMAAATSGRRCQATRTGAGSLAAVTIQKDGGPIALAGKGPETDRQGQTDGLFGQHGGLLCHLTGRIGRFFAACRPMDAIEGPPFSISLNLAMA